MIIYDNKYNICNTNIDMQIDRQIDRYIYKYL